jgi:hypothetical protein
MSTKEPSKSKTAAHEAGHAVVYAAVGIPVVRVQVKTERVVENGRTYLRYGWTPTEVDAWSASGAVTQVSALIRRSLGNAAGVVGEVLAGVHDGDSDISARSDFEQVATCLCDLGVLRAGETDDGTLRKLVGLEAAKILVANRGVFEELVKELESSPAGVCPCPSVPIARTAEEDERLLDELLEEQARRRK